MRKLIFMIPLIMLGGLTSLPAAAEPEAAFVEGQDYEIITPPQPTQTDDKIEVLEIFWYGCPHCYDFEPYISEWQAGMAEDVEFRRMPGVFRKSWIPQARAYYTAEALGVTEQIHGDFFKAMHEQDRDLANENEIAEFFVAHGVSRDDFDSAWNSFTVDGKVKKAVKMGPAYQITGVPSVIINGKYRTAATMTGSYENLLEVMNYLVDKERGDTAKSE